jgi:hypothetical protein
MLKRLEQYPRLMNLLFIILNPTLAGCIGLLAFPFLLTFQPWGIWAALACLSYGVITCAIGLYITQIYNQK